MGTRNNTSVCLLFRLNTRGSREGGADPASRFSRMSAVTSVSHSDPIPTGCWTHVSCYASHRHPSPLRVLAGLFADFSVGYCVFSLSAVRPGSSLPWTRSTTGHSPDVHGGGVARLTQHLLSHYRQGDQFVRSWSEVEDSIGAGARYGVHGGIH
jgi:hypothetical protein